MEYNTPDQNQFPEYNEPDHNRETAYKIAIGVLIVILVFLSFLYWQRVKVARQDSAALKIELDTLQNQTQRLVADLDGMQFDNDTLNENLQVERHKADSLMDRMKRERSISYSQIQKYKNELGTLRVTMQGFVRQIDSLNRLNQKLVGENIQFRKDISDLRLRTEVAQETAHELNLKVQRGSQIKSGPISVNALNKNNKNARNARQTARLVVSFDLTANDLSMPGERNVYVRIISPEGYTLQETQGATFNLEGENIAYSAARTVDYQGDNLPVSVYYNGAGLTAGKYTIHVYIDGLTVGTTNIILK